MVHGPKKIKQRLKHSGKRFTPHSIESDPAELENTISKETVIIEEFAKESY